jgi:hypothetical protein
MLTENRYSEIVRIMKTFGIARIETYVTGKNRSCPLYPNVTLSLHNHENMAAIL